MHLGQIVKTSFQAHEPQDGEGRGCRLQVFEFHEAVQGHDGVSGEMGINNGIFSYLFYCYYNLRLILGSLNILGDSRSSEDGKSALIEMAEME